MSWFHFTKQDVIKRNREIRREYAETCRKEATENVFIIGRTVTHAFKLASEEEQLFSDYFGEPMPQHLQMALHLEIILWRRIQAGLERANADAVRLGLRRCLITVRGAPGLRSR